jgi:DNA (cytosine-5)-methyltransferase 1
MKHGSLFSGIGGFDLAAEWIGWTNVFQVEIDKYCQRVLAKNFPNVERYGDIREFDGTQYRGAVDVLSGGFPCQPFSVAGKRKGKNDDRFLWPEMLRVIREIRPSFIVGENVTGIIGMGLRRVLSELEDEGYWNFVDRTGRKRIAPVVIPACAVKARHRRDRIWIVADNSGVSVEEPEVVCATRSIPKSGKSTERLPDHLWRPDRETYIAEMAGELHGISRWVDRSKGLGNAIVPQVAFKIFQTIERQRTN